METKTTITHKNGGIEQAILEAVNNDGLLNEHDKERLKHLQSLPQNRTEILKTYNMETSKTVNTELWHTHNSGQIQNRTSIMRGKEKIIVLEHYADDERKEFEELIVTAVNSCKQINAANPLKVAAGLPKLFEVVHKVINDKKLPMNLYIELSSIADTLTSDF